MTDKEKIRLWAKGRLFELLNGIGEQDAKSVLPELLSFIDSLEEEPKIPPVFDEGYWERLGEDSISEDMEKAAKVYEQIRNDLDVVSDNQMVERAFKAGAKWQKEQMIEEKASMSCVLEWYDGFVLNFTEEQLNDVVAKNNINIGDKVKVFVMKED